MTERKIVDAYTPIIILGPTHESGSGDCYAKYFFFIGEASAEPDIYKPLAPVPGLNVVSVISDSSVAATAAAKVYAEDRGLTYRGVAHDQDHGIHFDTNMGPGAPDTEMFFVAAKWGKPPIFISIQSKFPIAAYREAQSLVRGVGYDQAYYATGVYRQGAQ